MSIKKIEFIGEVCNCLFGERKICHTGLIDSGSSSRHKGKHHITFRSYVDIVHFNNSVPELESGLYKITIEKIE